MTKESSFFSVNQGLAELLSYSFELAHNPLNRCTDTRYDFPDISEVKKITCKEEIQS